MGPSLRHSSARRIETPAFGVSAEPNLNPIRFEIGSPIPHSFPRICLLNNDRDELTDRQKVFPIREDMSVVVHNFGVAIRVAQITLRD